jgi:hypothetical protein
MYSFDKWCFNDLKYIGKKDGVPNSSYVHFFLKWLGFFFLVKTEPRPDNSYNEVFMGNQLVQEGMDSIISETITAFIIMDWYGELCYCRLYV